MINRPKRRWFRFSLRTLFVVVTVFCVWLGWLGWQWRIVQERESASYWLRERLGDVWRTPGGYVTAQRPSMERNYNESLVPSRLRTMLGDQIAWVLELPPTLSESERERMLELYPEAEVLQWSLGDWTIAAPMRKELLDQ